MEQFLPIEVGVEKSQFPVPNLPLTHQIKWKKLQFQVQPFTNFKKLEDV
jgi:hypothetical protein